MPTVDLDLQLKFLNELDEALSDALHRYDDDGPEKLAELKYMRAEVTRARRIVAERMACENIRETSAKHRFAEPVLQEAAFS